MNRPPITMDEITDLAHLILSGNPAGKAGPTEHSFTSVCALRIYHEIAFQWEESGKLRLKELKKYLEPNDLAALSEVTNFIQKALGVQL